MNNTIEVQEGLNDLIHNRVANRIQKGSMNAQNAIQLLIEEGKASNDYIAMLGAGGHRVSEVTFNANGKVKMILPLSSKKAIKGLNDFAENTEYTLHENAVGQLGEKFKIPTRYIRELATGEEWQRSLAANILNSHSNWTPKTRSLVRTVGSEVRGVLSENYRRLNSPEIITSFLEMALSQGAELADGFIDGTRVYMEVLMPQTIAIPTEKNGIIEMVFGARLSTSDYGDGALELRAFMMQGICLNGMVRESVMRQVHLGGRLPDNMLLSNRTYDLDTRTQASAVKDLTKGIFTKDSIRARALEIQGAAGMIVDMDKELKSLQKGKLGKEEVQAVEKVLMRNNPDDGVQGESTLWKLVQGITAHSREIPARRSRELQEIAGELMNRVKL